MTLAQALEMARENRIEDWVNEFLNQSDHHGNAGLSKGLKLQKRFWQGPLELDFVSLIQGCGPSKEYPFYEPEIDWNITISKFKERLENGENPPPLIVEYRPSGFYIADGNHRYGAMKEVGLTKYWCVVWCNSEKDYLSFKENL